MPQVTVVDRAGRAVGGVVSSAAAPVLMVAGWSVAAGLQPRSFDPVAEPVSALAAVGAADRWVMSLTFVVVGACVFVTGLALRPACAGAADPDGWGCGGHAGRGVPRAFRDQLSGAPHDLRGGRVRWGGGLAAGAWRRGPSVPWGLRPTVSAGAVAVLLALVAWFGTELITGGGLAGVAERIFGAGQALWPLAVVASCRHAARKDTRPGLNQPGARPAGAAHRPIRRARRISGAPGGTAVQLAETWDAPDLSTVAVQPGTRRLVKLGRKSHRDGRWQF